NQPLRSLPPDWRAEILRAARQAAPQRPSVNVSRPSRFAALNSLLASWLWPHPKAWAGLAAVWVVILGLNFATREPSGPELMARQAGPPSPQMRELLQQQEQLLAELVGPIEKPQASRSQPVAPPPRSQRRGETFNA
ncbi:MAG TPA: hypothetical protein VNT26_15185, partial [Candidatus Sulfotelmatobacter sp.]|nr:hypothetical protein [Candidatus Sulfotelmatobacter sp.]